MTEIVGTWWWRPPKGDWTNFGDELGPHILARLGLKVRRVGIHEADIFTIGSIMEHIAAHARDGATVWGSGYMKPSTCHRKLDVVAVRGQLTAGAVGANVPMGDPALLCGLLWSRPQVTHRVGFVPHYADQSRPHWADTVIDVTQPVDEVVAAIGSCATIVSSSLHGLIVAESFGIPAMRIPHKKVHGGDFKWVDYTSGRTSDLRATQDGLLQALGVAARV